MEEAHERKMGKYEDLDKCCRNRGWRATCWPVEVGCRGFAGQSLCRAYTVLGITGERWRRAIATTIDRRLKGVKMALGPTFELRPGQDSFMSTWWPGLHLWDLVELSPHEKCEFAF